MPRLAAGLPDPLVRLTPRTQGTLGLGLHQRPQPARQVLAAPGVQQDRVQHRPVDVVLALVERAVADPHRGGALVPRQLLTGGLAQVPSPVDAVHDLQPTVGVGLEVGDELHELVGLPVQVQEVQRLQRERRVPHPRVPVVPVPLPTGGLGQRRRQRRHRRPGRHVRQPLDRQRRPLHRVPQRVVRDARPRQPGPPELHGVLDPRRSVRHVGRSGKALGPRQRGEGPLPLRPDGDAPRTALPSTPNARSVTNRRTGPAPPPPPRAHPGPPATTPPAPGRSRTPARTPAPPPPHPSRHSTTRTNTCSASASAGGRVCGVTTIRTGPASPSSTRHAPTTSPPGCATSSSSHSSPARTTAASAR